nr:reverse transcriptase domain-containing protein [Tanacetum cinerariifolium]
MAKMFLGKYFPPSIVTKLKNEITNFRQCPDESLFEAWERYKLSIDRCPNHNMLPVTQIDAFYNGLTLRHRDTINAAVGETFMKRHPKECYDLIENMTAHHNDWETSAQRSESSSSITSSFDPEIVALKVEMAEINKNLMKPPLAKSRTYMLREPIKVDIYAAGSENRPHMLNKENYVPWSSRLLRYAKIEREIEVTKDTVPPTNNGSTKDVQPLVVQVETPVSKIKPVVAPVVEPVAAPTGKALIDVYARELTLRVNNEAVTFNLDLTSRYSANYNDMTANRIDVIDIGCEEYSQEVLGFSDVISSGNLTPYYDPIVSTSSPTLNPFEDSDFLLEEVDAFLALEDDPTSPKVDQSYYDREPLEVELKDLPLHLEYAFLEGDDKLPVIIAKDLSVEENAALIKVLKSHKQAIAWKLSDVKGINPEFCTHKILMEDNVEPAVQHQRRVNPKIHDVIKKRRHRVLCHLDLTFYYFRKRRRGVDEPELGNLGLDKLVLGKMEAGCDHDQLLGRIGFFLGCSLEEFHDCFLDSCFNFGSSDSDCFGFDFD